MMMISTEIVRIIMKSILGGALFYAFVAGIFPESEHDPVIQIANMVVRQGHHEPFLRNVFTLNTCAPIVGSQVLSFADERELLEVSSLNIKILYECC